MIPIAVVGLKPPLPRPSSDRSTVPRATSLATVSPSIVDAVALVSVESTVDRGTDVEVVVAPSGALDVVDDAGELAATAAVVVDATTTGFEVVAVAPCEATAGAVGGGEVGCGAAAVVTGGGGCTAGAAVVVTGDAPAGFPQSDPLSGFGGSPSIGGGGGALGGGVSAPTLPRENDHPSTAPGGGTRAPGPREL